MQGGEDVFERLLRRRDGVAIHGVRTIDHDREVQRARRLQPREERLETRHRCHAVAIRTAQGETAHRLRRFHARYEIAVHDGPGLLQGDDDLVGGPGEFDLVRKTGELGLAEASEDLQVRRQLAFHGERGFGHQVRPVGRLAKPGSDCCREKDPQPVARSGTTSHR